MNQYHLCDVKLKFPGMDYSLYSETANMLPRYKASVNSKKKMIRQADQFLDWLKSRDERIVVGRYQ
jgi:hypothetical protein